MRNRRKTVFRLLLFAGALFVFGQFTIFNQVVKDWIWGSDEIYKQPDVRNQQERLAKGSEELPHGESNQKHNGEQRKEESGQLNKSRPAAWPNDGQGKDDIVQLKKSRPAALPIDGEQGKHDIVQLKKSRPTAWPMNSFISPYHKHWDVNCPKILAGNRTLVKQTNMMLKKLRDDKDNLPMPTDPEVETWMDDCSEFKKNRHYLESPLSDEEEEYPLAYIILTHKEVVQVERLLRSIYQPHNVYCLHPDIKSPPSYQSAIRKLASCFDNVFIASKLENIQYAGYTRLQADINCMSDLLKHPIKWKYVMNLCGQDFPLKTNLEIVRQLKAYNGHNDINGIIPPPYIAPRTKFHHKMDGKKPQRTKRKKTPPPYNLTIYFGNAYYAAMREFVDFVINDKVAIDLLNWSNDTWSPDEHYWVTLQRSSYAPGGYPNATWDENIRFMKWGDVKRHPGCQGKYVRALCVFGVGYLEYLHKQPYLFANKFFYSYDPIAIQCVEDMLEYRTWHPGASDKLDNFPVKDLVWQNYVPP